MPSGEVIRDVLGEGGGAERTAEIGGARLRPRQGGIDRRLDGAGGLR